eukprot:3197180-Rhodomonas_salina.2
MVLAAAPVAADTCATLQPDTRASAAPASVVVCRWSVKLAGQEDKASAASFSTRTASRPRRPRLVQKRGSSLQAWSAWELQASAR